jgi:splicing factor 1
VIIGPRGQTQKQLEKETGCKISIRGKGSVLAGKRKLEEDTQPLHVFLSADTALQIERATKVIAELLIPKDDDNNPHKIKQLIDLAKYNGTWKDHQSIFALYIFRFRLTLLEFNAERSFQPANVKCKICAEVSHPTSDCPFRGKSLDALPTAKQTQLAEQFDLFMADIESSENSMEAAYTEFKQVVGM